MGASITVRTTPTGRRFVVRYRLGGRAYPVEHGGSFATKKEAETRRNLIGGEIAAGRNPRVLLDQLRAAPLVVRSFKEWADAYQTSRVDLAEATKTSIGVHVALMLPVFGTRDPATITTAEVQEWIAGLTLAASSARLYVRTLRAVLDYAGAAPNPARDARVRLPRISHQTVSPPSSAAVAAIVAHSPPRWRLALETLAATGMRVGEIHDLEWQDVDTVGWRFRIRAGKTPAARRWVTVPPEVMERITAETPPDDRVPTRRVFPGASSNTVRKVMWRACKAAGLAAYSPHDLRHRYVSVQMSRGVPVTNIAAQVGHTRTSMTFDTYSHVLLEEGGR
jgi:integrase